MNVSGTAYDGMPRQSRWLALTVSVGVHVAVFYTAIVLSGNYAEPVRRVATMLDLVSISQPPEAPPPPRAVTLPVSPVTPQPPRIDTPPPIVAVPTPQPLVTTLPKIAPQPVQAEPAPVPAPAAPKTLVIDDLGAKLITFNPPRYPLDSRRMREQGVVVLRVLVGEDGRVESISIGQSSGFDRLDKAALSAVRSWRWSPVLVGGAAVRVQGTVRIPFELKG